ncbi:MAG: peptidoglycan recognition family protein [Candidatus Gastranaerophilales bacterium]
MKKIILHWSAGGYLPSIYDLEHYHYLVDNVGGIHRGKYPVESNEICKLNRYAAHTGGGNTGAIGVSMCAMAGFLNKNNVGKYPITKKQFEATMELIASLSLKYNIKITPNTVLTHYEFGLKNPKTSSAGKIDIVYLPPYDWLLPNEIGGFIRAKIKWYLLKIKGD